MKYWVILFLSVPVALAAGETDRTQPVYPAGIEDMNFSAQVTKSAPRKAPERPILLGMIEDAPAPDHLKIPLLTAAKRLELIINF